MAFTVWWVIFCLLRCCISSHGFKFLLVRYWPREKIILRTLNGGESHLIRCLLVFVLLKWALMRQFMPISSWIFWDGTSLTRCYIMFQFDILSLGYWLTMQIRFLPLHFPICRLYMGAWFPLLTMPVGSDTESSHVVLWNQSVLSMSTVPANSTVSFVPSHCCAFLVSRDFSSLILSMVLYTLKNILLVSLSFESLRVAL